MEIYARMNTLTSIQEESLLTRAQWQSLFSTKNYAETLKMLSQWKKGIENDTEKSIDEQMAAVEKERYLLGEDVAKGTDAIRFFTLKHETTLLKQIFKQEQAIEKNIVASKEEIALIKRLYADDLSAMEKDWQENKSWQRIYLMANQIYHRELLALAETFEDKALVDFIKTFIDLENLSAYLQGKNENTLPKFLRFSQGGHLDETFWIALINSEIQEPLQNTQYAFLLEDKENFTAKKDSFLLEKAITAKTMAFGVLPFLAYMFAANMEDRNIRLLLTAQQSQIPITQVKERMRILYEI